MSLRNLLPIGRTFEPSGERLGRFRPAEPGLLPDFSKDLRGMPDGRWATGEEGGRMAVKAVGTPGGEALLVGERTLARGRARAQERAKPTGRRLPVWMEQLILVLMRPGNRRRGSRPVQEEFCLPSLKVAKNDLVTADVEVVVRAPERPKAMSASCRARLMALWWAPVARRLGRWGHRSLES